ncbi:DUF4097 family beta strand repeat-containing protein [Saccharomonospora xinjiangensis]|nr:DUF4097 family beta strand repeat-containing protein [Saccharomonospora xinjiangensis]
MGRGMKSVVLAVGGIVLVVAGVAIAANWTVPIASERTDTVKAAVERVDIDNDSGNVAIRSADVTSTVIEQRLRYHGEEPGRTFEVDGSTLLLHGCGPDCSVEYEVRVPFGVTVEGEVSSGDILVEGTGNVSVRASSGDVELRLRDAERVSVRVESGNIDAELREVAEIEAMASSGNVDLDLAGVDRVRANAESGDVTATVPTGDYRVRATTDSGESDVSGDDPTAERVLDLTTSSGDVTVRGV